MSVRRGQVVIARCDAAGCEAVGRVDTEAPRSAGEDERAVPLGWLVLTVARPLVADRYHFHSPACLARWTRSLSVEVAGDGWLLTSLGAVLEDPARFVSDLTSVVPGDFGQLGGGSTREGS